MTTRRRALLVTIVAACAVLLSGCMRMHVDYTLHEDDTASGSLVVAFSDDLADTLGMTPEELADQSGAGMDPDDLPEGATSEPYAEDGYTGTRVTFDDTPIDEIADGSGADDLTIERDGDEFVVSGQMDLTDTSGASVPDGMLDSLDVQVSITFPGEVTEHTGELEGENTVVWKPAYGEVTEISARGSAVSGSGLETVWLVVIAVLVFAAIAGLAVWLVRRGAKHDAAADGAGTGAGADGVGADADGAGTGAYPPGSVPPPPPAAPESYQPPAAPPPPPASDTPETGTSETR